MSSIPVLISSALLLCLFIQCEAQNSCLVFASSSASDESSSSSASSSEVSTSNDCDDSGGRSDNNGKRSDDSGERSDDSESCNPDEVLSECIQNVCRIQSCSQRGLSILCAEPVSEDQCTCGCVCPVGTLRNDEGICVPEDQCPGQEFPVIVCPENEIISTCSQNVCGGYCSQKGYELPCAAIAEEYCQRGCVCQSGYLRTAEGNCVSEERCNGDLVCDENEIANSCPGACDDFCPTSDLPRVRNCLGTEQDSTACGEPKCTCRFNYRRDIDNETCIPTRECPPFDCSSGPNQVYDPCPPLCPTDDCSQATPDGRCPIIGRIGIVVQCEPACRCVPGYWRDNGVCVPYLACPGKCPPNEEFSSCSNALCRAQDCSQRYGPIACPLVTECEESCVCIEGSLRNENGECVPENECPPPLCGENEQLNECTNGCDSDICPTVEELERLRDCVAPAVCGPPRCDCLPGYARDGSGNCIPLDDCPAPTCGENEQLNECTNGCDSDICPTVEELERLSECVAPAVCGPPRCDCLPGYARDGSGNCIPLDDCPPVCPPDEELSDCIESVCRPQNCSDLNVCTNCGPYPNEDCSIGCICVEGLVRGDDGRCIPEDQCGSELTCGPNEEVDCVNVCPPETTCRTRGILISCLETEEPCQNKCVCKENFYRNYLGECISNDQCDQCSKDNEFFSCGQECDNECADDSQNRTNCDIINIVCNPQCYCEDGFARDYQGNCVPLDQCPETSELTCGPNEEVACVNVCPPERTCRTRGVFYKCQVTEEPCQNKCVCKENFYRNYLGECISNDQCDQCSKDNEFFSCGQECDNECADDSQNRTNCDIINIVCNPQCYCEDGYARDYQRNCVPLSQCPETKKCGLNEEYGCVRTCPPETCLSLVARFKCDSKEYEMCNLGCKCKSGFLRQDDKSPCLPICECDELQNSPDCAKSESNCQ